MKITISILLLFVCFGCKIRENKASSTYKAKNITVNSKGTIGEMYDDDTIDYDTCNGYLDSRDWNNGIAKTPVINGWVIPTTNDLIIHGDTIIPISGEADVYPMEFDTTPAMYFATIGRGLLSPHPQYDTQKVIMLVCDTSSFIEVDSHNTTFDTHGNVVPNATQDFHSTWQYGYTLNDVEYYNGTRMVATESNKYLDADKKPLSKSIIVWQTKELK